MSPPSKIPQEVKSHIYMLTPTMHYGIFRQFDGGAIITIDHSSLALSNPQVIQDVPQPNALTSTQC
ncbi:hypothetical protein A2U01_0020098, partial [Trifolium medium]|nr:hypothetical protein [Trifolium medium]